MVDAETGAVLLYEKSINQIFATRGLGKSVVNNALLRPLIQGGDWLKFHSEGGLRVVLVARKSEAVNSPSVPRFLRYPKNE